MKTIILTLTLTIVAHQTIGAFINTNVVQNIKKHNKQIEVALGSVR
jgi:hypothetical protein